jgi:hypothetical protein
MSILDTYNQLLEDLLKEEQTENAALHEQVKDLTIINTNLHVASVTKPPVIVYRLNDTLYGAEHFCDLDRYPITHIQDLYEYLDGDWSAVPDTIKQYIGRLRNETI